MRVLITGGAGYLGSVLCERLLAAGHAVVALDSLMYGQTGPLHLCADPNFEFVRGDCRDSRVVGPLVQGCDAVVPLAAVVGARACDLAAHDAWSTNLSAVCLLNRLRSADQRLVFPSTNSGYGVAGEAVCTEDSPLRPVSLYGRTKVQAEADVLSKPGSVSLRLATLFGASPRMRADLLVNDLVRAAALDGHAVIYEKEFRRNFVHVRDVADGVLYCLEHPLRQQPYNLGLDSANMSKEQLALRIREQVPGFDVIFAEVGEDPDKRDYVVSSARLRAAGFEARRTLEAGIAELLKAYRMLGRNPHANA